MFHFWKYTCSLGKYAKLFVYYMKRVVFFTTLYVNIRYRNPTYHVKAKSIVSL